MSELPSLPRTQGRLRVRIDSPDPLVAAGLASALEGDPGIELTPSLDPQVLLLWDAGASQATTRERLAMLPASSSAVVLIADPMDAQLALAAGAQGVLLRELDATRLRAALHAVHHRLLVLDVSVAARFLPAPSAPGSRPLEPLTTREREVLQLVADGFSNRRIGTRLGLSEHTVKFHVNAILEKLDADSRTQAVVTAVRRGLLWL